MPFVSSLELGRSWKNAVDDNLPESFFGFLFVLKNLNVDDSSRLEHGHELNFVESSVSNDLERTFYFGENPREYTSSTPYWVLLSRNWHRNIQTEVLDDRKPSLLDVALICLHNHDFNSDVTSDDVINVFKSEFNLTDEFISLFNLETRDLDFVSELPTRISKKENIVSQLNEDISNDTLTFNKPFSVSANAGALTRAPFFQTLYSSQKSLRILLLTRFNFLTHYGISTRTVKSSEGDIDQPHHKIIYGAAGTGKSHYLNDLALSNFNTDNISRITFHPSTSYFTFVGTYKPIPIYKQEEDVRLFSKDKQTELQDHSRNKIPLIDYTFASGVFLDALIQAYNSPSEYFLLIIEEINRANVASVFGEIFQLLDRDENGFSSYPIRMSSDITDYLNSKITNDEFNASSIKIPPNLYMWATMNSADQGVQPLDTAFKRRWSFEYLPLNKFRDIVESEEIVFQGKSILWNTFRDSLNQKLIELGVQEDKLIAPFFMTSSELRDDLAIKNKLLLYLRDDLVRHSADSLFYKTTFHEIVEDYDRGNHVLKIDI